MGASGGNERASAAAAEATLPRVGDVVAGKYRIERLLRRGGMGTIFAAHHELLRQPVALKVLHAQAQSSPDAAARFMNEARTAASIQGEHVARVFDVGVLEGGTPYIVFELLEGRDLHELLVASGPLSAATVVDYVLQTLEALAEAHALGVVHRDLKPANLFLATRRDGATSIKVLDFGISRTFDPLTGEASNAITSTSTIVGSLSYMAPEQLRSPRAIDARADIWAMGVVMYELLTARVPFPGDVPGEAFAAILERPPPALREACPDLPEGLEKVVTRCLSHDRELRYRNVVALAEAIAPFGPPGAAGSVRRVAKAYAVGPRPRPVPVAAPVAGLVVRAEGAASPRDVGRTRAVSPRRPVLAEPTPTPGAAAPVRPPNRLGPTLLAVVAGLVLAIGVLAFARWREGTDDRTPRTQSAAPPSRTAGDTPPAPTAPVVSSTPVSTASESLVPDAAGKPASVPARLPAPSPGAADRKPRSRPAPPKTSNCNPNFTLDADGEKHFKPECF